MVVMWLNGWMPMLLRWPAKLLMLPIYRQLLLKEYGYSEKKLRTEEAEIACGASAMEDSSKHALPHDNPMFEAICAAMEEAEKSWGAVSEFEASVSKRFKDVMDRGRGPVRAAKRKQTRPKRMSHHSTESTQLSFVTALKSWAINLPKFSFQ